MWMCGRVGRLGWVRFGAGMYYYGAHWMPALYVMSITLCDTHTRKYTHTHARTRAQGWMRRLGSLSFCNEYLWVTPSYKPNVTHTYITRQERETEPLSLDVSGMCVRQPLCLPLLFVFLCYMCCFVFWILLLVWFNVSRFETGIKRVVNCKDLC